mmetsp:Transcript_14719/g.42116  ORF Transcript_14719/g.42116 Transcript_14719/m.42116 type:complete len:264 (+) Transcript_14719:178-969(+)
MAQRICSKLKTVKKCGRPRQLLLHRNCASNPEQKNKRRLLAALRIDLDLLDVACVLLRAKLVELVDLLDREAPVVPRRVVPPRRFKVAEGHAVLEPRAILPVLPVFEHHADRVGAMLERREARPTQEGALHELVVQPLRVLVGVHRDDQVGRGRLEVTVVVVVGPLHVGETQHRLLAVCAGPRHLRRVQVVHGHGEARPVVEERPGGRLPVAEVEGGVGPGAVERLPEAGPGKMRPVLCEVREELTWECVVDEVVDIYGLDRI